MYPSIICWEDAINKNKGFRCDCLKPFYLSLRYSFYIFPQGERPHWSFPLNLSGYYLYLLNHYGCLWNVLHVPAVASRLYGCDSVKHVKAVRQLTEARILRVKMRRVLMHYEKLR